MLKQKLVRKREKKSEGRGQCEEERHEDERWVFVQGEQGRGLAGQPLLLRERAAPPLKVCVCCVERGG